MNYRLDFEGRQIELAFVANLPTVNGVGKAIFVVPLENRSALNELKKLENGQYRRVSFVLYDFRANEKSIFSGSYDSDEVVYCFEKPYHQYVFSRSHVSTVKLSSKDGYFETTGQKIS